ncbi:MAG: tetratricopeptide repeat protein [Planctomycetota bacterium]|jgi:tetratricopeptide (TPR) repeat protein|nr:tetratricopeptide repeat protein [Planctomycetota bacterium]
MRSLLLAGICILLCTAARAATPAEEATKYRADIDEGVSLLRTGSRDEIHRSIAKFKSALKSRPESAEAYYWLALAYSDLNNYLRAADNAKDATTYDDRLADAWLLWGQVLLYQKDWNEARIKLETAVHLAPEDPVAAFNLGRAYYHGFKDPDNALSRFRSAWQHGQATRRDNPEMIALTVRSRLYMGCCEYDRGVRTGNPTYFDNAINCFLDVVREQPRNLDARLRLALALRKANRANECEQMLLGILRELETLGPNADRQMLAEVNLNMGDLYLKDALFRDRMRALIYLREFVALMCEGNHPALDSAREYVAMYDEAVTM